VVIIGMMQNDLDNIIDEAIFMSNNNKKYVIDRNVSIKNKNVKKLIINKKMEILVGIGTVIICTSILFNTLSKVDSKSTLDNYDNNNNNKEIIIQIPRQEKYIQKYCDIYGLKPDVVGELYKTNKEYFNSINYLKTSGFENYNEEVEILTFVRHLYQKPEDFNVDKSIIINPNSYMNNNLKEEVFVKYHSDLLGIDPALVLAIEYQETTFNEERYASDVYNVYNNPAGLIDFNSGKYWKFPSKEAGIIEHIYQLKKYYIDQGKTTPEQIKLNYAPDKAKNDPNDLNQYWVENVNSLMEDIKSNPNIWNNGDYKTKN